MKAPSLVQPFLTITVIFRSSKTACPDSVSTIGSESGETSTQLRPSDFKVKQKNLTIGPKKRKKDDEIRNGGNFKFSFARSDQSVFLPSRVAATIEEDLKIFSKIRLVGDFEAFFPSNPIVLLYGFQHLLSFKTEVGSAQEFLCFQLDGGSTRGVALNFTFWYLLGTSRGTRLCPVHVQYPLQILSPLHSLRRVQARCMAGPRCKSPAICNIQPQANHS